MELDHLSYSSISTFTQCQRFWRFRYLDQIPAPRSSNLIFGSAFHNTIEDYIAKREPKETLLERWSWHWITQTEEKGIEVDWGRDTPEELYNTGVRMLSHEDVLSVIDNLSPLSMDDKPAIEKYIELSVPGVPIPIIGYIDIIEQDGVPGDFKTSSKSWYHQKAQDELQPVFYLAALNQAGFDLNPEWRFRHYVFVKTKTPQAQIWETQREPAEMFWLFGLIRECWEAIEAGIFPPTGVGSWKCQPRYCEYYGICRGKK